MVFKDRQKQNPTRFKIINSKDENQYVIVDMKRAQADDNLTGSFAKGTLLNAEVLNGAFAEKQDKLSAGYGIKIDNNVIAIDKNIFPVDYDKIAKKLITSDIVNRAEWKLLPSSPYDFGYGIHYFSDVENNVKYAQAHIEFKAEDICYDLVRDADPTIGVRFIDSENDDNSLFCLFGFAKNRVRLIKRNKWSVLGVAENIVFPQTNGIYAPMKISVIRSKKGTDSYYYEMYLNDKKVLTVNNSLANTDYNAVSIGTIGCRATIKEWKVGGTY